MEIKAGDRQSYINFGVERVKHISTLDMSCCLVCASLDGTIYSADKAKFDPCHDGCRCLLIPITGDGTTIGNRPYKVIREGKSDIGVINSNTTFSQWLAGLCEEDQLFYLGEYRFNLYANYDFSLSDFVNYDEHRELTQEELEFVLSKKLKSKNSLISKFKNFFKV